MTEPQEEIASLKNSRKKVIRDTIAHSKIITTVLLCMVIVASILVLTIPQDHNFGGLNNPMVGQDAPKTIYASIEFKVPDNQKIAAMRKQVLDELPLYYFRDENDNELLKQKFYFFVTEIQRRYGIEKLLREGTSYEAPSEYSAWKQKLVEKIKTLSPRQTAYLYQKFLASNENLTSYLQYVYTILDSGIMPKAIRDEIRSGRQISVVFDSINEMEPKNVSEIQTPETLSEMLSAETVQYYAQNDDKSDFRKNLQDIFSFIFDGGNVKDTPESNLYNRQKQQQALELFQASLKKDPVEKTIHPGDIIFKKNATLSKDDIETFIAYRKALNNQDVQSVSWQKLLEKISICLIMLAFICIYVSHVHPELVRNNKSVWLLGLIAVLALLADRF